MSHVIGRGRYARATYPQSPGAGGAASILPLSRQRFIDGDTPAAGPGAADAPFKTIAAFIATRTNVSVPDANANYVGWIMPSLNGYTEDVSLPPYASTELRASSFTQVGVGGGVTINGDVTWVNKAGAHAATEAIATLSNMQVTGDLTVTDDVNAPASSLNLGGDSLTAMVIRGNVDTSTTTKLVTVFLTSAVILGNVNGGLAATGAQYVLKDAEIGSPGSTVVVNGLAGVDSGFDLASITTLGIAQFAGCTFANGTNPVLTVDPASLANFDGPSWIAFLIAGGTRGVTTVVQVEGGADGGLVEGAALPTVAGNTNVSFTGAGASAGFTGSNCGNHYSSTGLAADASVTLFSGGNSTGDTMLITKTDLAAAALTVINGGGGGGTLAVIPNGSRGFVKARWDGANFILVEIGTSTS